MIHFHSVAADSGWVGVARQTRTSKLNGPRCPGKLVHHSRPDKSGRLPHGLLGSRAQLLHPQVWSSHQGYLVLGSWSGCEVESWLLEG